MYQPSAPKQYNLFFNSQTQHSNEEIFARDSNHSLSAQSVVCSPHNRAGTFTMMRQVSTPLSPLSEASSDDDSRCLFSSDDDTPRQRARPRGSSIGVIHKLSNSVDYGVANVCDMFGSSTISENKSTPTSLTQKVINLSEGTTIKQQGPTVKLAGASDPPVPFFLSNNSNFDQSVSNYPGATKRRSIAFGCTNVSERKNNMSSSESVNSFVSSKSRRSCFASFAPTSFAPNSCIGTSSNSSIADMDIDYETMTREKDSILSADEEEMDENKPSQDSASQQVYKQPRSHRSNCCRRVGAFIIISALLSAAAMIEILYGKQDSDCDIKDYNSLDVRKLHRILISKVYGQPFAHSLIPPSLEAYLNLNSDDAGILVLAFHGFTGIGKNFVSQIISEQLDEDLVHKLLVVLHFPYNSKEEASHFGSINEWFSKSLSYAPCATHLFVIDEVDGGSPAFLKGLYKSLVELKTNKTSAIVLLLSNVGGFEINQITLSSKIKQQPRENIDVLELQEAIKQSIEKRQPGLATLYNSGLVDVIIPFLPLEDAHVRACISEYLSSKGFVNGDVTIERVLEQMDFFPANNPLFSKSGCRKVPVKVDLVLD